MLIIWESVFRVVCGLLNGMVWLGKWGVGWSGSGFELSVGRDGVGVRSAFHVVRVGYGMVWFGVWVGIR